MTQTPAGWYPEPDPAYADRPGRLRYWDGQQWTEHVHEPAAAPPPPVVPPVPPVTPQAPQPGQQPPAYPGYPTYGASQQEAGQYGQYGQQQQYGYQQYGQQPYPPYGQSPYAQENRNTTPDGVALAGWGWRALARFLDGLISIPLLALALTPVFVWQWDSISQWFDDVQYAADNNTATPSSPDLFTPFTGPWLVFLLVSFAAYLIYESVFLFWKQATPGKLILGMRVRLRELPDLPAKAIWPRVLFPLLGQLCFVVAILDYLWPLWDSKKQALHDKVAKTNVVKPEKQLSAAAAPPRW